jgi:hypothetical protein
MVQGFKWCLNEPRKIPLKTLASKILCKKHNSALSDLDAAALAAFEAIRENVRLSEVRNGVQAKNWRVVRLLIDGMRLERWFLKTLINFGYQGEWCIGPDSKSVGEPSKELVEIAFGRRKFENGAGLYIAGHAGEKVDSMDRVNFMPQTDGQTVVAGVFNFRGHRFRLNLLPMRFDMYGPSNLFHYTDAKLKSLVWGKKGRQILSHEIGFNTLDNREVA